MQAIHISRSASFFLSVNIVNILCLFGCTPTNPVVQLRSLHSPLVGECASNTNEGQTFSSESQSMSITVRSAEKETPFTAKLTDTSTAIPNVPAGENQQLIVDGLVNDENVWRGVRQNMTILPNEDNTVDILMARVGDWSCARTGIFDQRVFHTATRMADGRVLIVGGANSIQNDEGNCGPGCRRLTATSSAAIYDPSTGSLTQVGSLQKGRLFHTASALSDGRVVIVGGTTAATIHQDPQNHPFPIKPQEALDDIEVFLPKENRFVAVDSDGEKRVFAAAITTQDDSVLITGGIPGPLSPRHDLSNALSSTTICSGSPLVCRVGPPLAAPRAGHQLVRFDPEGIMVVGGSVNNNNVNNVSGWQFEKLENGQAAFRMMNVAGGHPHRNVFFAAVTAYSPLSALIVGGWYRDNDGTFHLASLTENNITGASVYRYLLNTGSDDGGISTRLTENDPPLMMSSPLVFGFALPMNTKKVLVGGGFRNSELTSPSAESAIFDQSSMSLASSVSNSTRAIRSARGGAAAAELGDGTFFVSGGLTGSSGTSLLDTAEIFASPENPLASWELNTEQGE